jgi:DNA-binding winged helix-turn-helix (wHTH) protein
MDADRHLTFEGFSLDLANERLVCNGEQVALTPKAFAVLRRLVEGGGKLVTKAELLRAGWADTHVTDGVIKVSILEIRRALGDDPSAPRFIETVPRRGYRLIAPRSRTSRAVAREDPAAEPVGRAGLLDALDARLERARGGERQLVFLSGEAGIGKTTVIDAFVARVAAEPDVMIARGACLEHYGGAEAYLPVLEALGRLLREPGSDRTLRLLERYAPTWVVQLPWVVRRDDRETLRRELLGVTKERMLREMAEALEVLTAEMPLVLVLEDLHWRQFDARSSPDARTSRGSGTPARPRQLSSGRRHRHRSSATRGHPGASAPTSGRGACARVSPRGGRRGVLGTAVRRAARCPRAFAS